MDDETSRLQWNPHQENLAAYTTQTQGLRQWSDGGLGNDGQVLTSGGSSAQWNWQNVGDLGGGVPTGVICMWSGASNDIPTGWVLCDNSTAAQNAGAPDLRNKFVVGAEAGTGANSYPNVSVGAQGGYADSVVVQHSHGAGNYSASGGNHSHTYQRTNRDQGVDTDSHGHDTSVRWGTENANTGGNGHHTHSIGGNSGNASNGMSGSNRNIPPFYAICFIYKT